MGANKLRKQDLPFLKRYRQIRKAHESWSMEILAKRRAWAHQRRAWAHRVRSSLRTLKRKKRDRVYKRKQRKLHSLMRAHDMGHDFKLRRPAGTFKWGNLGKLKHVVKGRPATIQQTTVAARMVKAKKNVVKKSPLVVTKANLKEKKVSKKSKTSAKMAKLDPDTVEAQQGEALIQEMKKAMTKHHHTSHKARRNHAHADDDESLLDSLGMGKGASAQL